MASPFPQTMWTAISRAKAGSQRDVEAILEAYRPAVVTFLRGRGYQDADTEDIAQEVFEAVLEDRVLEKADRAKGRFRNLLLAVTRHVLSARHRRVQARKRGGQARRLRLDDPVGPGRQTVLAEIISAREQDPDFDGAWVDQLLKQAFEEFKDECETRGRDDFQVLKLAAEDRLASEEIANRLGRTATAVRTILSRAREDLRRRVRAAIKQYCSSDEEYREEVACMTSLMTSRELKTRSGAEERT